MLKIFNFTKRPEVDVAKTTASGKSHGMRAFRKLSLSCPQRPRSFWSAPRIATSGRNDISGSFECRFEWLCKHKRLRPEPIRFVRLDSEHAQSDGKSVNRGLPVLDVASDQRSKPEVYQRSRFLVLTKRSAASGDENET